ncbi:MAG: ParB N-terminal domain-containing protein [Zoogloeaceae bacterium]|nr:ParB N-terminal domain-containing protein [Zoogloeaceae bacterium]
MKFTKAEIDAIIEASPRTFVAFDKLVLSKAYQARAGGSTPKMSVAELAASIKECGVLQNLIAVEGARGRCEVCAGGRRLEALTLLVGSGDLAENYPVPVLIVPADKALIASLAENCFHIPMHPADEFAAFARLIGQGKSVEDVAAAFGVTPLVVKRRMKLATVSPKLMAAFREDQIGLDCLMVLASVDDHHKQEQTWAALPSWNRRPDYLRQLLIQGEIESDRDPVAKYVTLEAYENAGGALRRDLFSDDDNKAYLLDAALLEKLATDRLQELARQIAAEGWKWVDVRVRYAFDEYVKYGELRQTKRQPDAQEVAAMEDLDRRIAALHAQMETLADEDGDEDAFYRLEGEAEGLEEQCKALDDALSVWPADLMAQAGCVVHVGHNGAAAVKFGLIRPDDRSDMAQAARQATGNGTDAALLSLPSAKTRPVHSERLVRSLTAHRVAAVQAELIERPDVALAAITAHLAQKIFRGNDLYYCRSENVFAITATDSQSELRSAAEDLEASAAWSKLQAERTAWAGRLPKKREDIFPWLLAQDQATVLRLLTFVVAVTVTGIYGSEPDKQSNEALARALGLDMSKWWTATGPSYFNHVSKARILEVVSEAVDPNAASPLAPLKKDAVVTGAEQTLAGTGWLPACLRIRTAEAERTEKALDNTSMAPGEPALMA